MTAALRDMISAARWLRISVLLVGALLLSACTLMYLVTGGPNLHDIRLESLEVVDVRDRREYWHDREEAKSRIVLMVTFSSPDSLVEFHRLFGYTIGAEGSLCADSDQVSRNQLIALGPYVYDGAARVDSYERRQMNLREQKDEGGRHQYHFFLELRTRAEPADSRPTPDGYFVEHDLRRDPHDLCFHLRGGSMAGHRHRSSTVVIPYPAIRAALDRAGL